MNANKAHLTIAALTIAVAACAGADRPSKAKPATGSALAETCGWLVHPADRTYSLIESGTTWSIQKPDDFSSAAGWQGGPEFATDKWIATDGPYGYGCACLNIIKSVGARMVTRYEGGRAMPLAWCRSEPGLKEPGQPVP